MTRLSHRIGAVAAALAATVLWGAGAAATVSAATGQVSNVEVTADRIQLVFEALDTEEPIDQDSVTLTLDGVEVPVEVEQSGAGAGAGLTRTTMLVMDTSGSMNENNRLAGAKQAAQAFVAAVPADVRVGLVTFDDGARVVEAPSTDRSALSRAIAGLQADGSTAIFDAVVLAARQLGGAGARSIVLLTDGEEEGSRANLRDATSRLRDAEIRLDAVAFQTTAGRETLDRLARAGQGDVLSSASAAELTAQFEAAAERISRQLVVTAEIPADAPSGQVTLTASGLAGTQQVSDTTIALLQGAPSPTPSVNGDPKAVEVATGPFMRDELIWIAAGLFFLGLFGVMAFAINAAVPNKGTRVSKQLSVYTLTSRGKAKEKRRESTVFGGSTVAQSAVDLAGRITAKRGLEERLQRRLEAAAVPLKPAEWILVQAAVLLVLPVLGYFGSGGNIVITLVALAIAVVGPSLFLTIKEAQRRKKFVDSLPEVLQLMAGSLSAGYSLPQAVDTVVREGLDPVATEFNKALVETRLGVPIEDAMETIADRMRSVDWKWVVMAIRVQREVGGNLSELLLTVAATLRDRARIRRQIQTLSAEGRLSAWILGALPVVFSLYLLVARPSYILMLTKEPLGWLMIAGGVIFMTVGAVWMKKIVDVEV